MSISGYGESAGACGSTAASGHGSSVQAVADRAGPFEVEGERNSSSLRDAVLTGLLVIYPAFATVAAIVAGLLLAGASA
jgi:hypothetical protein